MKHLDIYCDGSSLNNPGPSGWAFIVPNLDIEKYGYIQYATNNQMELMATIEALKKISEIKDNYDSFTIFTDSKYVVDSIEMKRIDEWIERGWRTKANKVVKNIDQWEEVVKLKRDIKINFVWVKGHSSNRYNIRCDYLAVNSARQLI